MTDRKTEPPLHLDMEFGEALGRFAQTKPEEVTPPKGKKPKMTKAARQLRTLTPGSSAEAQAQKNERHRDG